MKKAELKAMAEKYNMEILRHPVTGMAHGLILESEELIPELDELADKIVFSRVQFTRSRNPLGTYRYTVEAPSEWFDLWGWK